MNIILLGAPGAGKGTQAEVICQHYDIPAISTGNILREAVKNETEAGKAAKSFMDAGKLVPDEVIIAIIKERLSEDDCKKGFILDGVPRTVAQAEALDAMGIQIDKVIDIEVADEEILQRLSGRRVCGKCGASYHLQHKPPMVEGKCDKDGADLIIRKDDEVSTIKDRLAVYHEQTEPLKGYYEKAGKLIIVEGQGQVADTTKLILSALEA